MHCVFDVKSTLESRKKKYYTKIILLSLWSKFYKEVKSKQGRMSCQTFRRSMLKHLSIIADVRKKEIKNIGARFSRYIMIYCPKDKSLLATYRTLLCKAYRKKKVFVIQSEGKNTFNQFF